MPLLLSPERWRYPARCLGMKTSVLKPARQSRQTFPKLGGQKIQRVQAQVSWSEIVTRPAFPEQLNREKSPLYRTSAFHELHPR